MKQIALLLIVLLLFTVSGCEGKESAMSFMGGARSAGSKEGKNPGGTGMLLGEKVPVYEEPTVKSKQIYTFPNETSVILRQKCTTKTEGIWIEIKRKEDKGWVQGWVKSEQVRFNWKEDGLQNLQERVVSK